MNKQITRKAIDGIASIKGIDSKARTITAYASTNEWDRYGERFEPDAFSAGMENYLKNPVVLFGHDYGSPPIGKTIGHYFDAKGLILTMEFAETQMAKDIFALYEGGFMNAFSVGFRPLEVGYEERTAGSGDMGAVFKKAELLENSAVPVPANPGALVKKGLFSAAQRIIAPHLEMPTEWAAFEKFVDAQTQDKPEGAAPDLGAALGYLINLGKMIKHKGKVRDEVLRSYLIQASNLCRELIYGPGTQKLDGIEGPMTDEEVSAMVKEFEVLSARVMVEGSEDDKVEIVRIAALVEKAISGN